MATNKVKALLRIFRRQDAGVKQAPPYIPKTLAAFAESLPCVFVLSVHRSASTGQQRLGEACGPMGEPIIEEKSRR